MEKERKINDRQREGEGEVSIRDMMKQRMWAAERHGFRGN